MRNWLIKRSNLSKWLIVSSNDFLVMCFALWVALGLRFDRLFVPSNLEEYVLFLAAPALGLVGLRYAGVYRLITRDIGYGIIRRTAVGLTVNVVAWSLVAFFLSLSLAATSAFVPRTVVVLYWVGAFLLIVLSRGVAFALLHKKSELLGFFGVHDFFRVPGNRLQGRKSAIVVGYEPSTPKIAKQITQAGHYRIVGIIHDDETMHHRKVDGIKIYPPGSLSKLIGENKIDELFLLVSKFSASERVDIIKSVEKQGVSVKHFPTFSDIELGRINISELRPVNVEQLLGREPVPPLSGLLENAVRNKVVMITGAGGSIGAELARMIINLGPEKLILFEISETALYGIEQELAEIATGTPAGSQAHAGGNRHSRPQVVGALGSVNSQRDLESVFRAHDVDVIYHAAAYKHVPIVERNIGAGIRNNTLGTLKLVTVANSFGVKQLIMISTDKAVRPTSVMGASKRIAEMVLQSMARDPDTEIKLTMVRFGNVLGSSGSVVPLFQEQIKSGGPITITHRDMVRYFMSMPEAAQLVIQAGSMAENGAVYVLDMGEPVKIVDLARAMVNLAGFSVRDEDHPEGDIETVFTGLREGEKLFEELLISDDSLETQHPRIRKQIEPCPDFAELSLALAALEAATQQGADDQDLKKILGELVEEYRPRSSKGKVIEFRRAV